jgi:hypothetical protein
VLIDKPEELDAFVETQGIIGIYSRSTNETFPNSGPDVQTTWYHIAVVKQQERTWPPTSVTWLGYKQEAKQLEWRSEGTCEQRKEQPKKIHWGCAG